MPCLSSARVKLPAILACLAYVTLVCSGLFVWAAADAPSLFALTLFAPPIVALLARARTAWLAHDCNLVRWPPAPPPPAGDATLTDAEVAQGMFQDLISTGAEGGGGGGGGDGLDANLDHDAGGVRSGGHGAMTLGNMILPPLEGTKAADISDIQMRVTCVMVRLTCKLGDVVLFILSSW